MVEEKDLLEIHPTCWFLECFFPKTMHVTVFFSLQMH
jgi:hypothetical protein